LGRAPLNRGADAIEGTPQKKDARKTARPNADVANRTPGTEEELLGCSGTKTFRREQCDASPYVHCCAMATMEIVKFPEQQIVTTDCLLSNNEGNETRYSISVITEGSLRNSKLLKMVSPKRFEKPLYKEVQHSPTETSQRTE
jgi:hypothetical protein